MSSSGTHIIGRRTAIIRLNGLPPILKRAFCLQRYADGGIVIVCLVVGALVGSTYYRDLHDAGRKPWFYQVDFGPAVMWTCGYGFVIPEDAAIPPLRRFLRQEVDQFSCADLPPVPPVRPEVGAQPWLMWSHLLRSAAVIWTMSSITWSGLAPLAGCFLGVTVALAYVAFRLVSGRLLSTAGAVFVLTSPLFLSQLPQFRDFSKVPFMLGLALLMAQLLILPITAKRLLTVSAAYGAVLGFAIGFRNDVFITIPPFLLLVVMSRPFASLAEWRLRGIALLLAGFSFIALSSPVLRVYANGGGATMSHAALLGMMHPIDSSLSVTNGGLYEIGYGLDDSYAAAVISGYASRKAGVPVQIDGHSRDYDAAAGSYLRTLVLTLPGDALTRAYAVLDYVIALPSGVVETDPISYRESLRPFYAVRSQIALSLWWVWPLAVVAAILLVSLRDLRLAAVLGLMVGYFCSYPAIQFNDRHVLHLSLIPTAALAYVLQTVLSRKWGREWRNAFILVAVGIAVIVVPLLLLRRMQDQQVRALINAYLAAPAEQVQLIDRALPDDRVALDFDFSVQRVALVEGSVATDYLIADFDAAGCDASVVDLTVRYETSPDFSDFTHRVAISLPQGSRPTRVTLATYSYSIAKTTPDAIWYRPKGYELPAAQRACLTKVSRLLDPSQFPVLLNATLPPDWERLPLYSTLARWEGRSTSTARGAYLSPPDVLLSRRDELAGDALRRSDLVEAASNVTMTTDGGMLVDGADGIGGLGRYTLLARFQERPLTRGRRIVMEGNLRQGGLSVGWLKDGSWSTPVALTEPGPFIAVFEVPSDGNYAFAIANNLRGPTLRNVCEVTRLAWLP